MLSDFAWLSRLPARLVNIEEEQQARTPKRKAKKVKTIKTGTKEIKEASDAERSFRLS